MKYNSLDSTVYETPAVSQAQPTEPTYVFPSSFAQRRLWFLQQLEPNQTSYLVPMAWRLTGQLSVPAIVFALNRIAQRHESLRTSFQVQEGEPVQVVDPYQPFDISVEEVGAVADRDAIAYESALREANTPFDLSKGPLFRCRILRFAPEDHVLLFTIHHIVFDGWSKGLWMAEFGAFYREYVSNEPAVVADLPIQYGDFATWQQDQLTGKTLSDHLSFWSQALEGAPTLIDLPTDRPRPKTLSPGGAKVSFVLDERLTAALRKLARETHSTLFMVMLSAFHVLLSRYAGQEEVLVGTPIANRERLELEPLIGFFANSLVMRGSVKAGATFLDVLAEGKRFAVEAYARQDMPFDKLVEELQPERSTGANPLFQVMFAVQNVSADRFTLPGITIATIGGGRLTAKLDLFVSVVDNGEALRSLIEYSVELYDAATIERLAAHYQRLLSLLVEDPTVDVTEVSFLSEGEPERLLVEWNQTQFDYPREKCLQQLFEEQALLTPDSPAVAAADNVLTYAQLNERANRLSHLLIARGVGAGSLVGVCLNRSEELLVALLAILKTGAAYLPLDPAYPLERLDYIVKDAKARLIITEQAVLESVPTFDGESLCLDTLDEELSSSPDHNPGIAVDPQSLAYVLHTSGSTGKPKGVEITQRNLVNFLLSMKQEPGITADDKLLAVTTLSFDISGLELYLPLLCGACVVIASRDQAVDAVELMKLMDRHQVSIMQATPATWRMLLEGEWKGDPKLKILCGGEAMPPELAAQLVPICRELWNMYGPTETTIWSAVARIDAGTGQKITIGHPIANTQLHLLDANRNLVPVGVLGELYIGGDGVGRGYWGKPELTAERFVADPFNPEPGARMFRTGDMGRRLSDGRIDFLGRADHQVKIRGFRIELGEIETVLARNPDVQQCVVVAREDTPGDKRLVAYVVPNQNRAGENGATTDESESEQVSRWATAWDDSYREGANTADDTFNLAGWNSSYTGQPIPADEMRLWVETTVQRILQLKAKRVWEIGCGTGLLLFRVAPHTEHYHGTDISETALGALETQVGRPDIQLPQVTLTCRPAHEGSGQPAEKSFDLVVLNSVIQYFPDADYLAQVLSRAVDSLDGKGSVFIGDVRNHALLNVFRTSVELYNAPSNLSRANLLQRVEKAIRQEEELVVDPEFFFALQRTIPRINRVEIQLKRGAEANELTRFRYDVTLHVGHADNRIADVAWIDWTSQNYTLDLLRQLLEESQPNIVGLTRIPNAQLQFDVAATALLSRDEGPATAGDLREALDKSLKKETMQPELLFRLIEALPYHVEMRPSRAGDGWYCDALLVRKDIEPVGNLPAVRFPGETDATRPWAAYCNNPLQQNIARALVPKLREWLAESLPDYMVPSAMVVLDALPLSSNGKINRRALPRPDYVREDDVPYVAPRSEYEIQLAAIWSDALHVPQIGLADNFFSLGGHSLLGTQIVSRIRKMFQVELPLRSLFESPTLEAFAATLEAMFRQIGGDPREKELKRAERNQPLPLSFAQQRFWFLDQLEPGSPFYNMPMKLRLRGPLNIRALESALSELVARHEILRTTFVMNGEEPIQVISPPHPLSVPVTDLSDVLEAEQEDQARQLVSEEVRGSFDLHRGPLFRPLLLKLAADHHVMVLNAHHIVTDGWSSSILRQELFTLYDSFSAGAPSPLPALPLQYADYAVWQRTNVGGAALDRQLAYWKEHLRNAPPSIDLATDRPRPPVQTYRGSVRSIVMPRPLLDALKTLGQKEGTTLFMTLLAAFNVLLSRYSGQDDIVIGSAIAGRTHSDTEKLIGLFVNTLALRTDLSGNPTFQQLLGRVRKTTVNAYAHQDVPFERLVEEINPVRDSSRNPLYQVMMVLQNTPNDSTRASGLEIAGFGSDKDTSQVDIMLNLVEQRSGLRAAILYNTDLFDDSTIERMLGHYGTLLDRLVENPAQAIAQVSFLTEPERRQFATWNQTDAEFPREKCLHQLFEEQAQLTPDAMAVRFEDSEISYRELNERANQLAHFLGARGVRRGGLVGVCAERSIEMVVALLGIQKAGGAYVPIDPEYPHARIESVLEDTATPLLLTQTHLLASLPSKIPPVLCLDRDWPTVAAYPKTSPQVHVSSKDIAYAIYTSGSTGKPKGVPNVHAGVVNRVLWMQHEYLLTAADRVLQKTPYSFDVSVWEFFWPLTQGASLVMARPDGHKDPDYLIRTIVDEEISTIHFVPSMLRIFLDAPNVEECTSLKRVICSGEALTSDLVTQFFERLPNVALHNLYGPTEAAVDVTYFECKPLLTHSTVPIGRPVWNTQIHILSAGGQPQPINVPGELHIAGVQLARGYLNRPELTAERFIHNPFSSQSQARMYKTGDLCRWLPDGNIEYLGRLDHQVKLRGFRIELGEIEATLREIPTLTDCVVIAREDSPGDKRLVAYVVTLPGSVLDTSEVLAHLGKSLPAFMVPSAIITLPILPQTTSGKIDRNALPAPDFTSIKAAGTTPRTHMELLIAEIWQSILRIPSISIEDDFFQIGGHSLLATQMVSRVRAQLGIELPLIRIFSNTTLEAFSRVVEAAVSSGNQGTQAPLLQLARPARIPLSFAQQRLWFLDQLEPGSSFYNITSKFRLGGTLNMPALHAAIDEIVARHEILRTTYVMEDGQPVQRIAAPQPVALTTVDLSAVPAADRDQQARLLVNEESRRSFDLQHGPMLRCTLFTLSAEDHVLVLGTHHIATDGWSSGVLRQELFALYEAFAAGRPSPLSPLPVQYADYAIWQRTHVEGAALERQLEFWKEHLRDAPPSINLSTDRPRPLVQAYRGASRSVVMPRPLLDALKTLGQKEGATLFMTLLAAFNVLLSRYSAQDDIVVGSAIAGRTHTDTEKLIGLFVNTLALRTDLSGNPTFQELLARVRTTTVNAYANQDVPFERLVEEINPVRDSSRSPLYQVMLVLQNTPNERSRAAGLDITGFGSDNDTSKMDMVLSLMEQPSGLRAALLYNTDLFDGSTIERLLERYQRLLEGIVEDAHARVANLPLLSETEKDWLLYGLNDTDVELPIACIHELFERQVDLTPDAPALHFAGGEMTYRELDESANRFAHYLQSLNVGTGAVVGVCMERGFDLMIVLIGIFKSGAAYLALDPTYPADRLSMMLEDGDVRFVIAHQATLERVPAGPERILMDQQRDAWQQMPTDRLPTRIGPEDLAYVIHTSGSTGRPKGAMQHHGGIANFLLGMQKNHPMHAHDRFLSKTSLNFDASIWEIFWPLSVGAQVVISPTETYVDVAKMIDLMASQKVTYAFMVPSLLSTFTASPNVGQLVGTLRWVISGGEKVTVPAIVQFEAALPGVELHQCYGPTEASITIVEWACRTDYEYATAPLGRPVPNSKLYVLDQFMQPVPFGVAGELYIGGIPVGLGYLNRPDLTAERFLPNPFGPGRMYKTGDSVRYLPDNNLEFVGRLDFQIKLRGLRIELGEIETALRSLGLVADCVVVAREDSPGDKRVVAYFVPRPDTTPEIADLRSHLKGTLPEYMVPTAFVALEALPLSLNGKVDRKALPAPDMSSSIGGEGHPPRTHIEILVAEIWKDVLKIPSVNIEDDFFQLGGHSLLATQMVTRVRSQLTIELPLIKIFSNTTLESFARAVETTISAGGEVTQALLGNVVRPARLPLSFAQQRFWFLDQLEPGSAFYNVGLRWRLKGILNVDALEAALNEILARHEVLRTTYLVYGGEPVQIIAPAQSINLAVVDLSTTPEAEREQLARTLAGDEARLPFNLQQGPMFRAKLFKLADDQHLLTVDTHHVATDGWSSGVLRQELFTLYDAFAAGNPSPLPALPLQYADYAIWQRTHIGGAALDRQLEYWKHQLRDAPPSINLSTDRPRPAVQTYRGSSYSVVLPNPVLNALKALGQKEGTTLFMTLLAAFNVLLSRYSGQEDIVVGSAIAGRIHTDTEKLIGLFVNTLALRTDLSGNPTFTELLGRVRTKTINAYAHQDVPFERLVEEINPVRDSSRSPLYQVMMILQNTPTDMTRASGLEITGFGSASQTSQMDIMLNLVEQPAGLRATMLYNTDLFDSATIERMLAGFVTEIESVVAAPDLPISELSILSSAELNTVLCTFNDTQTDVRDICLQQLVAEQVQRTPDATALVDGTERLSFAELDRRANRVAHELIARGVVPDTLVGIYFDRSVEMLVALLGVLKSGGAYVPLDPNYPSERIAHILEAAHATIILSRDSVASTLPPGTPWMALSEAAHQPDTTPQVATQPHHLAYVLFTSGSTGRPKGVAIEHRCVATFIQWAVRAFTPEQLSGVLLSTSVCFDLSIFEIFAPLACGGKIILSENALHLPSLPARNEVTLINTVPSAMAELVRSDGVPRSVRTINLAGEALTADLVEKIYSHTTVDQVFNLYGPTEDTTYSTYTLVPRGAAVTIGRPISNTQALILDRELQPQPVGVPGELYLAGAGLARGYLNRPDLTAERFLPHPFNQGERMYKTGDLCRWLADGNIEYVGRLDHQVKLRGFRIELGEIESTLRQLPGMMDCVVIAREDEPGDKRLVAYIVAAAGVTLDPAEIRTHLGQSLPTFMVPAAFVQLPALPQTPNGKVDRNSLPAPATYSSGESTGRQPRTRMETLLAEIWKEVLKVESVNVEDDFFHLGGHSLMAAAMIGKLNESLGYRVRLSALFQAPTLGALANAAERQGVEHGQVSTIVPIRKTGTKPALFCVSRPNVNALGFVFLSRAVSNDLPVYGLQSNMDNDGRLVPFTHSEYIEKAKEYIEAMRQVQPEGPYFLTGTCEGAHIAFEMARQLKADNFEVGVLSVLDVWPVENTIDRKRYMLRSYQRAFRQFIKSSNHDRLAMIVGTISGGPGLGAKRLVTIDGRQLRVPASDPDVKKFVKKRVQSRYWPGKDFKPTIYDGDIVVFRVATQPYHHIRDENLGWSARVSGQVDLIRVPGTHALVLREPGVSVVGHELEARIDAYLAHRNASTQEPPEG